MYTNVENNGIYNRVIRDNIIYGEKDKMKFVAIKLMDSCRQAFLLNGECNLFFRKMMRFYFRLQHAK
jgi:hypothetical protein